ncbi:hypothetical protein AAVH_13253 [Aphelenchoides avenae]|nr:hypothetical protein AAVH_13253 [Aphelenchus avenae]
MSLTMFSWVCLVVELLFLLFHISVFICILRQICSKCSNFSTAFYKLYVLRSVADYGAYAAGSIALRLTQERVFEASNVAANVYIVTNFILISSVFLQLLVYLAVAANRYTAIIQPMRHQTIWKGRSFATLLTCAISSSLACSVVWVTCGYLTSFVYTNDASALRTILLVDTLAVILPTLFGSAYLEMRAFRAYFQLDKHRRRQYKEDYFLLVYAAVNFTAPVALAVFFAIDIFTWEPTPLYEIALRSIPLIIDFLSFSEPVWLMAFRFATMLCRHLLYEETASFTRIRGLCA